MTRHTVARFFVFAALWLGAANLAHATVVDDLLKQVQSASAVDRAAAVRGLSVWIRPDDPRPARAILNALNDTDRYVRREAVGAVQRAVLFDAVPRLHEMQKRDPDPGVRSAAAAALQDFRYRPGYDDYVVANSDDDKERLDAAIRLSNSAREEDLPYLIQAMRQGGSKDLQVWLVRGMGYTKSRLAEAPLLKVLQACTDDADPRKGVTIDALGAIGGTASVPALLKAWTSNRYDADYVQVFKTIHDPRGLAPLAFHVHEQYNNNQYAWIQTFDAYGTGGVNALLSVLEAKGSTDDQRAGVLQILAGLHTSPPLDPLLGSLTSPSQMVRFEAPAAIANSHDPRAVPQLLHRLTGGEQDRAVRMRIITALGAAGDRRATAMLLRLLADPKESSLSNTLVTALGRIGDPAAANALVAHYKSAMKSGFVWDDVVALCGIGTAKTMAPVLEGLRAGNTQVLQAAYACLVGYGEPGTETALLKALDALNPGGLTSEIADTFYRSGNSKLHDGAQAWAARTHQGLYGGTDVAWGSRRKP